MREIFSFITDDKTFCKICSALAIHIAPERRGLKKFVSNLPGALATVYLAQLLENSGVTIEVDSSDPNNYSVQLDMTLAQSLHGPHLRSLQQAAHDTATDFGFEPETQPASSPQVLPSVVALRTAEHSPFPSPRNVQMVHPAPRDENYTADTSRIVKSAQLEAVQNDPEMQRQISDLLTQLDPKLTTAGEIHPTLRKLVTAVITASQQIMFQTAQDLSTLQQPIIKKIKNTLRDIYGELASTDNFKKMDHQLRKFLPGPFLADPNKLISVSSHFTMEGADAWTAYKQIWAQLTKIFTILLPVEWASAEQPLICIEREVQHYQIPVTTFWKKLLEPCLSIWLHRVAIWHTTFDDSQCPLLADLLKFTEKSEYARLKTDAEYLTMRNFNEEWRRLLALYDPAKRSAAASIAPPPTPTAAGRRADAKADSPPHKRHDGPVFILDDKMYGTTRDSKFMAAYAKLAKQDSRSNDFYALRCRAFDCGRCSFPSETCKAKRVHQQ
eukprot:SAG31_NODE_7039_length_1807_cov_3.205504_1_plen_498_part_00